jgi:hypothetical protein
MVSITPTQGPLGASFANEDVVLVADAAITKGQVCKLTLNTTSTEAAFEIFDAADVAVVADAEVGAAGDFKFFGVALEDISSGSKGQFRLKGRVEAKGGDTAAIGTPLTCDAAGALHTATLNPPADADGGLRVIAVSAFQALTDGALHPVLFDGINGFGIVEHTQS